MADRYRDALHAVYSNKSKTRPTCTSPICRRTSVKSTWRRCSRLMEKSSRHGYCVTRTAPVAAWALHAWTPTKPAKPSSTPSTQNFSTVRIWTYSYSCLKLTWLIDWFALINSLNLLNELLFVPPPPLGGARSFEFYVVRTSTDFDQTLVARSSWDNDKLIRILGQYVWSRRLSGFSPQLGWRIVSGLLACMLWDWFLGQARGFDGVLYNLWPSAPLKPGHYGVLQMCVVVFFFIQITVVRVVELYAMKLAVCLCMCA